MAAPGAANADAEQATKRQKLDHSQEALESIEDGIAKIMKAAEVFENCELGPAAQQASAREAEMDCGLPSALPGMEAKVTGVCFSLFYREFQFEGKGLGSCHESVPPTKPKLKVAALTEALKRGDVECRSAMGQRFSAWLKKNPEKQTEYNTGSRGDMRAKRKAFRLAWAQDFKEP